MRIAIREKRGLSKPWKSGFDRGGLNLENRDLLAGWRLIVDGGGEGQDEYTASDSLVGAGGEGSA